jgi:phosphate-selective porin
MQGNRLIVGLLALTGLAHAAVAQEQATASAGKDDKGFFIAGGDAKLSIGGFAQFRYYANFRDQAGDSEDLTTGFVNRRTRLVFQGNLSKELGFKVDADASPSTGDFSTADVYGNYKVDDNFQVRFGQFKAPLLKEELVSDTEQAAVERSLVNSVFTGARVQGVQLAYSGEQFRGWLMLNDGLNSINTSFDSAS